DPGDAERSREVFAQESLEGLARCTLDGRAEQVVAEIRVLVVIVRRAAERRAGDAQGGLPGRDRQSRVALVEPVGDVPARVVGLQRRAVSEQVADADVPEAQADPTEPE